ncbi:SurA N-terminal domain-containing protein [Paracidovorax citrulli]
MLDFVRNNRRLMLLLLLVLVFPSFVFFGVESYSRFMDSSQDVAKVGDRTITTQDVDNVLREQTERMRQMLGNAYDPRQFEGPEARQAVIDQLVLQRVIADEVERAHLTVSNERLYETINSIPAIAQLPRKADGSVDDKAYLDLLAAQGMTPEQFDARLRYDLAQQQLGQSVGATAFMPKSLLDRLIAIRDQQREVQPLVISASAYAGKVNADEAALKAWYEQHKQRFAVPEQAKVEYLVLSADALAAGVAVTPEQLKSYYDSNAARFGTEEQRQASHILISAPKDAPKAERDAARQKAESVLQAVRQQPDTFADVARKQSQDPGSAQQGGDLGFMGRGALVKPFEDAMFSLKEGQISDLVETDYGFHIIKVTGIKPAQTRPLEAVRGELEKELRRQLAVKQFNEQADAFGNLVYEQSDSLKPAAERFKLNVQSADNVTRTPNPALGAANPLNDEKVLTALFSDESLRNKRNTEAIQVAPETLVAARVVEHRAATVQPFEAVREQVRTAYVAEQAAQLALKDGEARLKALREGAKEGGAAEGFGAAVTVSRRGAGNLPPKAVEAILRADAAKLPAVVGVDLGAQGYGLYRITKVTQPAAGNPAERQAEAGQLAQLAGQAELDAFYQSLKERSEVEMLKPGNAASPESSEEGNTQSQAG